MTLEYRHYESGKTTVVTTECGLCGDSLREQQGIRDHLPSCPARRIYAELGVLRDGGPNPERVQAAIAVHENQTEAEPELAADGGHESRSAAVGAVAGPSGIPEEDRDEDGGSNA